MPTLIVETQIDTPVTRCFDLARDISVHCATAKFTKERAVAGVTEGLVGLGDSVTFEAVHFGIRLRLTAKITEFVFPTVFVDEMTEGTFKSLRHKHEFTPQNGGTLLRDTLIWTSPFGIIGRLADSFFLIRHMKRFLLKRNANLKAYAES